MVSKIEYLKHDYWHFAHNVMPSEGARLYSQDQGGDTTILKIICDNEDITTTIFSGTQSVVEVLLGKEISYTKIAELHLGDPPFETKIWYETLKHNIPVRIYQHDKL